LDLIEIVHTPQTYPTAQSVCVESGLMQVSRRTALNLPLPGYPNKRDTELWMEQPAETWFSLA